MVRVRVRVQGSSYRLDSMVRVRGKWREVLLVKLRNAANGHLDIWVLEKGLKSEGRIHLTNILIIMNSRCRVEDFQ